MVESGKEFLILESYNKISWLIWIQMFIFFLLLFLLCVVGNVSLEMGDNRFLSSDSVPSTSDSSISTSFIFENPPIPISHHGLGFSVNSSLVESNQSEIESSQNIKGEITPSVTRTVSRTEEVKDSLEKDSSQNLHHPCNLFRLALLKCFGIDRSNEEIEDSLRQESKKER